MQQIYIAEVIDGKEAPETRMEMEDEHEMSAMLQFLQLTEPKKDFVVIYKGEAPPPVCHACRRPL